MPCKVKVNRHGYLAFRLYWDGNESWEGTEWRHSKESNQAEARAVLISDHMENATFDYLKWFPEGNRRMSFAQNREASRSQTAEHQGVLCGVDREEKTAICP